MEEQMSEPHLHRPTDLGTVYYFQRSHSDPMEVVNDRTMTTQQKREILADWASDRRAVRDYPALRRLDSGVLIEIDAVLSALKCLDGIRDDQARSTSQDSSPHPHHIGPGRRPAWAFWKDDDDDDPPPCPAAAVPWRPRPLLDATASLMVA
jgi:hypothetical protein